MRGAVPTVKGSGVSKQFMSKYSSRRPSTDPLFVPLHTLLGRPLLRNLLYSLALMAQLTGTPLEKYRMLPACHPPKKPSTTGWAPERYRLPRPKGISYTKLIASRCEMSLAESERSPFRFVTSWSWPWLPSQAHVPSPLSMNLLFV